MNDPVLIASQMICPNCGAPVDYGSNAVIYGRPFGSGLVYICSRFPVCDTYVGAHGERANEEQRYLPMGTMADATLRSLRKRVHNMIDTYWQVSSVMSRPAVYRHLAVLLNIPFEKAHVAMLDVGQCQFVLDHWEESMPDHLRNIFLSPEIFPKQE